MTIGGVRAKRLPATAPFNVCVYKVSDRAGYCWPDCEIDLTYALYQVQIAHEARPSSLMNFRDSFGDFLTEVSTKKPDFPANLEALRDDGSIKLVVSNKTDPDEVGFVQLLA